MENSSNIVGDNDTNDIHEKGLKDSLPSSGMDGRYLHEIQNHLLGNYNFGLKLWQYPNQFIKLVKLFSKFKINLKTNKVKIKDSIDIVRNIDIKKITEKELEDLLPSLGMNGENVHEMPTHLSQYFNIGLRFWQYPNQFSKYLKLLPEFKINSYLEIGCRWGGTFVITNEILKLENKHIKAFACDLIDMSKILKEYSKYSDFKFIKLNSMYLDKENVQDQVDLILIDGDHSYSGVKIDFERSLQYSPKYVVFHDIASDACQGVVTFWNEIKDNYKHHEFVEQYDNVNGSFLGIGVIEL